MVPKDLRVYFVLFVYSNILVKVQTEILDVCTFSDTLKCHKIEINVTFIHNLPITLLCNITFKQQYMNTNLNFVVSIRFELMVMNSHIFR